MNTSSTAPFRSMAMERSRTPLLLHGRNDEYNHESIDFKSDFNNEGIPLLISGGRVPPQHSAPTKSEKKPTTKTASALSSAASPWNVPDLPFVPDGVPLEPTALEVRGITPPVIVSRICTFLKQNSICCDYFDNQARVDCRTFCGVKFVVQLWKKKQDSERDRLETLEKESSDFSATGTSTIILEVQRRQGCCIVMRSVRNLLYTAVLHNRTVNAKRARDDVWNRRHQLLKKLFRGTPHNATAETKPRCLDLLENHNQDCNQFGLELLLSLINPVLVGRGNAEEIAQALAFGTGELGDKLRASFLFVFGLRNSQVDANAADDSARDIDDVSSLDCFTSRDCDSHQLRLLCLKVMSVCLDIVMEKERDYLCNEANLLDLGSSFWSQAIPFLLAQLSGCAARQHEAALAARCLRLLELLRPGLLISATDSVVVSKAVKAYKHGKLHHLLLEQESEKLLKCLNVIEPSATQDG